MDIYVWCKYWEKKTAAGLKAAVEAELTKLGISSQGVSVTFCDVKDNADEKDGQHVHRDPADPCCATIHVDFPSKIFSIDHKVVAELTGERK